jgi:hypothetical protein
VSGRQIACPAFKKRGTPSAGATAPLSPNALRMTALMDRS